MVIADNPRTIDFPSVVVKPREAPRAAIGLLLFLLSWSLPAAAEPPADTAAYRRPRGPLAGLGEAMRVPQAVVDPRGEQLILLGGPAFPPLAELSAEELELADLRFDPRTRSPVLPLPWSSLALIGLPEGRQRPLRGLPARPRLTSIEVSPDGRFAAFGQREGDGLELWLADLDRGRAWRLSRVHLNAIFTRPCRWLPDGRALVCRAVPGLPGEPPTAAVGPRVLDTAAGRHLAPQTQAEIPPQLELQQFAGPLGSAHPGDCRAGAGRLRAARRSIGRPAAGAARRRDRAQRDPLALGADDPGAAARAPRPAGEPLAHAARVARRAPRLLPS